MEKSKGFLFKVFAVRQVFFQCLHALGNTERVHPGQGPILGFLLYSGGGGCQADLVRLMRVSAATVAVSVARLERMGLVTRERNRENQRANVLRLTEEGERVALRMDRAMEDMGRIALTGFSPEDCRQLEAYCDRMIRNLEAHIRTKE